MQKLLMFMYHLTPDQAAARVPLFQFWLTAFGVGAADLAGQQGRVRWFWSMARLCSP